VRLVGVDALSIEPATDSYPVHHVLLAAGVVIVEGLDLTAVAPGPYRLVCLPLRVTGGDGAPARAILMRAAP
jgi:arylformamidase